MSIRDKLDTDIFYKEKLQKEGCKRLTIPMEEVEHLHTAIEVFQFVSSELEKISRQRVPQYLRLLHARMLIGDANQNLKRIANKDISKTTHYKGAV
jgi:hypothetical protein|tara:strand:+ start:1376 stop:1663 length:288 start_codon:yes stop_codon:yes gene_type:complete